MTTIEKNPAPVEKVTELAFLRFLLRAHSGYTFDYRGIPGMLIRHHYLHDPYMPGAIVLREEISSILRLPTTTTYALGIFGLDLKVVSITKRIKKTEHTLNVEYPYIRLPESFDQVSAWTYPMAEGVQVTCQAKFFKRKDVSFRTLVVYRKFNERLRMEYYVEGEGLKDIVFAYNPLTD